MPTESFRHFSERTRRFLAPRRPLYAFATGGALWLGWVLLLLLGSGLIDLAGQPLGTDYLQFYAAGKTIAEGKSAYLYDMAFQSQLEQAIIGPGLRSYHAFITPPFLAWLFVPFSMLPYGISFAAWSILGLLLLAGSVYLLKPDQPWRPILLALTWFPVFASVSFGQNALLSLFILSSVTLLWKTDRRFLAGLVLGLLMYKPQLTLGIALLWLLRYRRDWTALAGLSLSTLALATLSFGFLPQASLAYVHFARNVLPDLPAWQNFPIWHLHTVRGFWRMLLPFDIISDLLTLVCATLGLWAYWKLVKSDNLSKPLAFSAAICLTIWITPHAMIYDWVVLLIPAILLWIEMPTRHNELEVFYTLIWVSTLIGTPLILLQLRMVGFALQISIPILAFSFFGVYRTLIQGPIYPNRETHTLRKVSGD